MAFLNIVIIIFVFSFFLLFTWGYTCSILPDPRLDNDWNRILYSVILHVLYESELDTLTQ